MEGDRGNATAGQAGSPISIHALRVEGDGIYQAYTRKATRFLSTPSGWRATVPRGDCAAHVPDFYPRPPGGGRLDKPYSRFDGTLFLSTPSGWRATSRSTTLCTMCLNFYPRPPGGGRLSPFANAIAFIPFLSTPSGWRATSSPEIAIIAPLHFYPRPPGGGRLDIPKANQANGNGISIHALRVEGDSTTIARWV